MGIKPGNQQIDGTNIRDELPENTLKVLYGEDARLWKLLFRRLSFAKSYKLVVQFVKLQPSTDKAGHIKPPTWTDKSEALRICINRIALVGINGWIIGPDGGKVIKDEKHGEIQSFEFKVTPL